ncbi:MAG: UDP-N-acetylmuramoyl-tripeptide--D-alanyl-D-alanine ligase [Candidatus Aminicenantales bacterium]
MELTLKDIAQKTGGRILQGAPSASFRRFNIDSRKSRPGELFFALVAQRNGHAFIPDAVKKGASGVVVSENIPPPGPDVALIQVKDTLTALQELARKVLSSQPVKVIGITGSNGKTTTKEFAASLLSGTLSVLKSEGNYNNHIGLPLCLLRLENGHRAAVLEMGMSAPGEIARLTEIAPPDLAVITNIRPVHLEFFKSIEEIAEAKKEILEGLKPNGTAVLNHNDPRVRKLARRWKGDTIFYGTSRTSLIRAEKIRRAGLEGLSFELVYGDQRGPVRLPFFYSSFLENFLAASAVAFRCGVPLEEIQKRARHLKPFRMRGEVLRLPGGVVLIDDSYNSNPEALKSVLRDAATIPARRRIAVLGDMLELGPREKTYHRQVGRHVVRWGWDLLATVGPLSRHTAQGAIRAGMAEEQIQEFENSEKAAKALRSLLRPGDLLLIKGSRRMNMDRIVAKLKKKET